MKILINDFKNTKDEYTKIFGNFGYEPNELIFCFSYDETKSFLEKYLEKQKKHIDLIITNYSANLSDDILKSSELSFLKNNMFTSFSNDNFRISSIPMILYSNNETGIMRFNTGYNAIMKKNTFGSHDHFINECEKCIGKWRESVFIDLDNLGLKGLNLLNFVQTRDFKYYYEKNISKNASNYFSNRTTTLSLEFITYPTQLKYDWVILNSSDIVKALSKYIDTYKNHVKYDKYNNERTILHRFFNENKLILLRDVYSDLAYEKNLYDINARTSEECDFILKTDYPDFLKTTFLEIKKENATFYVNKKTKRPQISSKFMSQLEQIWRYKEYVENPINELEFLNKLDYKTLNINYILLAGRLEEKEEMKEKFEKDLGRMYKGITVITYEELEEININYLDKFSRINIA